MNKKDIEIELFKVEGQLKEMNKDSWKIQQLEMRKDFLKMELKKMGMNKKAASLASIGVAFMIGFVLIVFALGIAPAVKQGVDTARNTDNLNCSNTSISIFDQATCVASDSSQFLFIGGLIFLAFAIIAGARRLY